MSEITSPEGEPEPYPAAEQLQRLDTFERCRLGKQLKGFLEENDTSYLVAEHHAQAVTVSIDRSAPDFLEIRITRPGSYTELQVLGASTHHNLIKARDEAVTEEGRSNLLAGTFPSLSRADVAECRELLEHPERFEVFHQE